MKNKKQEHESATPVADAITEHESGKPIVNEAIQVSTSISTKKLGRPKIEGSKRQLKLQEMDAKRAANDGYLPLGRPKVEGSKRQLSMIAKEQAKKDGSGRGKGRPKMTEEEKAVAKTKREADRNAWLQLQAMKNEGAQVTGAIPAE